MDLSVPQIMSNIEPPHICPQNTVLKIADKIQYNPVLPTHKDVVSIPRLKSCRLFLAKSKINEGS